MKKNKNSAALSDEDRAKASGGAWVNLGKVNPSGSREKNYFC